MCLLGCQQKCYGCSPSSSGLYRVTGSEIQNSFRSLSENGNFKGYCIREMTQCIYIKYDVNKSMDAWLDQ